MISCDDHHLLIYHIYITILQKFVLMSYYHNFHFLC